MNWYVRHSMYPIPSVRHPMCVSFLRAVRDERSQTACVCACVIDMGGYRCRWGYMGEYMGLDEWYNVMLEYTGMNKTENAYSYSCEWDIIAVDII